MPDTNLDDLVARFRAGTLPKTEWTQQAHLQVGAWHVERFGPEAALKELRSSIRRLNTSHGTPNSETRGYHETITAAYVRLIDQFLSSCPRDLSLAGRVARLLASELAEKDFLLQFYSREVLASARARLGWVEPDRAPLAIPR